LGGVRQAIGASMASLIVSPARSRQTLVARASMLRWT
jgi:hypothetical protein